MDYVNEILKLFSKYKDIQKELKVFGTVDEKHAFLTHCIECLEDYEKDLLKSIMVEKVSVRQYSRQSGFSRAFITKEKERLINLIAKFFQVKYSQI